MAPIKAIISVTIAGIMVLIATQLFRGMDRVVDIDTEQGPEMTADNDVEVDRIWIDAWLPWWDSSRIIESLEINAKQIRYLLPMWYRLTEEGQIATYSAEMKDEIAQIMAENEVMVLPTIGNDLDGKRAALFLDDESLWDGSIEYLIKEGEEFGYEGFDLDWEDIPEANADEYVGYIRRVKSRFDEKGLMLSVTVHARTGSNKDWIGVRGHDYKALAEFADHIRVMAYDYHFSTSEPGAVTPLDWYMKVINHSLDNVEADKLIIGLPLYGYDWVKNKGESVMYKDVLARIDEYEGEIKRDEVDGGLIAYYTLNEVAHNVWFDDAQSVIQKIEMARERGIYQFVFWRLGGEDFELWNKLELLNGVGNNQ